MPRKEFQNSEWNRRSGELRTDRELVEKAADNPAVLFKLMLRYKSMVEGYLAYVIDRQKLASNEEETRRMIADTWQEMMRQMPGRITGTWFKGGVAFRVLLRECVHDAMFKPIKPLHKLLIASRADNEAYTERERDKILSLALKQLKKTQEQHKVSGNAYHTILKLRLDHPEESIDNLVKRFGAMPEGRVISAGAFSTSLSRAWKHFCAILHDEVEGLISQHGDVSPDAMKQALRDLGLMEIVLMSSAGREQFGLIGNEEV